MRRTVGFAFFTLLCCACLLAGTPFTKPSKSRITYTKTTEDDIASPYDTVFEPSRDSVSVAGFEKTLRSNRESMYFTNNTARTVAGMQIEITYLDMEGRMLHKTTHTTSTEIPSGETRLIDFPSFDRQGLYYYHLSPLPPRASRATPFRAKVRILHALIPAR